MRISHLFTKTRKEHASEEISKNEDLLIRAGYIHKEMAGVYALLPLGRRVFNTIVEVIRSEMEKVGGQEVSMTALQEKELWEKTGRWSDDVVDVWFKTQLKNGTEVGLGVTHEEAMARMMVPFIRSYKDLPRSVFQFQTKFRNETRAKSGIMRTREFVMKDLYSFAATKESHEAYYELVKAAYVRIFATLGIGDRTYVTFASGGIFSQYSHEFQTVCDAGEDDIYVHEGKRIAINKEVMTPSVLQDLGVQESDLVKMRASEVGNIFTLGTRFSEAVGLTFADDTGEKQFVEMGSYGIGPARVMGVIVEALSDDKGIVWPAAVAPFHIHLVSLGLLGDEVSSHTDELYQELTRLGIDVLFDDRTDTRAGEKFADADLLGMPIRVVVSAKSLALGGYELKERKSGTQEIVTRDQLIKMFSEACN